MPSTDSRPMSNGLADTFVQRHGNRLLGAEATNSNGASPSRTWGGPPISVVTRGHLIVVTDASQPGSADSLANSVQADLAFVAQTLGQPVDDHVLVDATSSGQVSRMNTFSAAEAAAVTFPVSAMTRGGQHRLAGLRININPRLVPELINNQGLLRHETSTCRVTATSYSSTSKVAPSSGRPLLRTGSATTPPYPTEKLPGARHVR